MAVRIRLKKLGRRHLPFYRIVATDAQQGIKGREIEVLGTYAPSHKDPEKVLSFDRERVEYWLSVGALPSDTVRNLLKREGVK